MAEQKKNAPAKQQPQSQLALVKRDVVDVVANKVKGFIEDGDLHLPENYSPQNALKAAWLILQETVDRNKRPVLQSCTKDSIANALLDMIVQGLNPQKKQLYFICYGDKLVCQRSYFGSMAVAKMLDPNIKEFAYAIVYEGDTLKYQIVRGKKVISVHEQDLENVDKSCIKAAYCMVIDQNDNVCHTEIMTFDEIKQAWRQSQMNPFLENGDLKPGSTHGKFTADMALKTVINKTCKPIINASDDNSLLREALHRSADVQAEAEAADDAEENANGEIIDVEMDPVEPEQLPEAETGETIDMPSSKDREEIRRQEKAEAEQFMKTQKAASGGGPGF